jgi:hypothetical protein
MVSILLSSPDDHSHNTLASIDESPVFPLSISRVFAEFSVLGSRFGRRETTLELHPSAMDGGRTTRRGSESARRARCIRARSRPGRWVPQIGQSVFFSIVFMVISDGRIVWLMIAPLSLDVVVIAVARRREREVHQEDVCWEGADEEDVSAFALFSLSDSV